MLLRYGALLGPALFLLCWLVAGLLYKGYSPVDQHISVLAGVYSPTSMVMNAGLVALAIGLGSAALRLRAGSGGGASMTLLIAAASVVGIILTPDGSYPDRGFLHAGFALVLYATLAAIALVSGLNDRVRGADAAAILAIGVAVATTIFFWLSLGDHWTGLFQRLGFTTATGWLVATRMRGRNLLDR